MANYSVATTKDQLSKLIARAQSGEDVVITTRGKPSARIVPANKKPTRNRSAAMATLLKQIADLPPTPVPVERFSSWLYEDPDD